MRRQHMSRRRQGDNHNITRRNSFSGRSTENTDYSPYSQQPAHSRTSNGNDYHGLNDRDSRRASFYNYYDDDRQSYDSGSDRGRGGYEAFSWNEPNRHFDQDYHRDFYEEENDRDLYRRNQNQFSDYDDEVGSYEPDMYPRRSKNSFLSSRRQGFDENQMRRRQSRGDINDSRFNTNEFDRDAYDYKEDER